MQCDRNQFMVWEIKLVENELRKYGKWDPIHVYGHLIIQLLLLTSLILDWFIETSSRFVSIRERTFIDRCACAENGQQQI